MKYSKSNKNSRELGIDIIKTIAVILIPILHYFLKYGFYNIYYDHHSIIFQLMIRWVSFSCIGLFILSTGYLQCERKLTKKYYQKLKKIIFTFFIFCIITIIITNGVNLSTFFKNISYNFLQCKSYFWYIGMYIGLYLFIPFINIIIEKLEKKQFQNLIIILLIIIAIPEFINSVPALDRVYKYMYLPSYWIDMFPIMFYIIGAYIKKYQPKIKPSYLILTLLFITMSISLFSYWYADGKIGMVYGGGYASIINVIISVTIFLLFYKIKNVNNILNKMFKWISNRTLEIYLSLVIADFYTRQIMNILFEIEEYHFKYILIEPLLDFIIALVVGSLIKLCIDKITTLFSKLLEARKTKYIKE